MNNYNLIHIRSLTRGAAIGCFLLWMVAPLSGQTLADYQKLAADSNAMLKSKFLKYHASLQRIPQVGGLPDPEISFGYFISPVETRVGAQQATFSAKQMFPWMGTLKAKKDVAAEQAKANYEAFETEKDKLQLEVAKYYLSFYWLKKSRDITQKHIEILQLYNSIATQRFEAADGSMVDVLRVQMEQAELANKMAYLDEKMVPEKAMLNRLLGRDSGNIVIPDTLIKSTVQFSKDAVGDSIVALNNELKRLEAMRQANANAKVVARKMGAPKLGVGINYIIVNKRNTPITDNGKDALLPMVTLKLPIWRAQYKGAEEEKRLEVASIEQQSKDYKRALLTMLEMYWADLNDANRRITLYKDQYNTVAKTKRLLMESYSTSGKEFEELLRVERMMLKYELEIIRAVKDNNLIIEQIKSLM